MGADDGWNIAVAVELGERLGHQQQGGRPGIAIFRRRIDDGAVRAKISEHVPTLPPKFGGDKYSMSMSWQPDLGRHAGAAQLWHSLARQPSQISIQRLAAFIEKPHEDDPAVGGVIEPANQPALFERVHPAHRG